MWLNMHRKLFLITLLGSLFAFSVFGQTLQEQTVVYKQGDTTLEGFSVVDPAQLHGKKPAVVVVHAWKGLNEYAKERARMLARMGYVAFAADIYGQGVRPETSKEAAHTSGIFKQNRQLWRARVNAAVDQVKAMPNVDPSRVAAIGYCFGGGSVLELARSGADVRGVVSFHGNLDTPTPEDAKNIKGSVLVLHGAADPYVKQTDVTAFMDEMQSANVDWNLVQYGGAVHSFTDWDAGTDPSKGAAYDPDADRRSWQTMQQFLAEVLR